MAYTIGVSSGLFSIARSQPNQAEGMLTVLRKVFWGAQRGVQFTQMDLDTIAEFDEPYIMDSVKKIKELGLRFGLHSETQATGAHTMALDSALGDEYQRGHERMIDHIKGAGKISAEYVLTHISESTPLKLIGTKELQSTQIVDFWGNDIGVFLKENPEIMDWAWKQEFMQKIAFGRGGYSELSEYNEGYKRRWQSQHPGEKLTEEKEKDLEIDARKDWEENNRLNISESTRRPSLSYGTERLAYALVAKWMEMHRDPIWIDIVGEGEVFDEKTYHKWGEWVTAVTAKYIWGHFNPKDTKKFKDPKKLLAEKGIYWVFESEMGKVGWEKHMRLVSIPHIYKTVKAIGSPWVKVAIDFEHLLSAGENPIKNIENLPHDSGKDVYVIHVGWPTPHAPGHVPLYVGSEAQQYVYEGLYKLRQKGWKDGIIIFERGGGEDPVKTSVASLRQIVKYLNMDIEPEKLPEDFFGWGMEGGNVRRQFVNLRMHAYDPLGGLITQPEEEHGFIGKTAIDKGKGEQWKKEKYK
jgi:hypothetical protein